MLSVRESEELWAKVLKEVCHCRADKKGNRACDYGIPCEKCLTGEAEKIFWEMAKRG